MTWQRYKLNPKNSLLLEEYFQSWSNFCLIKFYRTAINEKDKFIFLITGGRGSGKSFSTSTFLEHLTFEMTPVEKIVHQILYTRYTMVSANISIIPEFLEKAELDGTQKFFRSTRSDVTNRMTGSRVMFLGIKSSSGNQTANQGVQG